MAVAVRADEWTDAEVTKAGEDAPPCRVRPVALAEVAPAVVRALRNVVIQLGGCLLVLWFIKWLA